MITLEVRKVNRNPPAHSTWELIIRNYFAQGIRPEYTKLCTLTEEMARFLVEENLAGDMYGELRK